MRRSAAKEKARTTCQRDEETRSTAEDRSSPSAYLERVFPTLLPALEETLAAAAEWNSIRVPKCRPSGLDYLAESLWNKNPRRTTMFFPRPKVFDIPPFKRWLRVCPRPIYPKFCLLSDEEAAVRLQRYVRGWLVRKRADVQELRQFWKDIAERNLVRPSMEQLQESSTGSAKEKTGEQCARYREAYYGKNVGSSHGRSKN